MSQFSQQNSSFTAISPDSGKLGARYLAETGFRQGVLQTAWLCAAHTWPFILPQPGQSNQQRLPESHQAIGARGIVNQVGKALSAMYPADTPFFQYIPNEAHPDFRRLGKEAQQFAEKELFLDTLLVSAMMEGSYLDDAAGRHKRPVSFRGRMANSFAQLFITGDTLERMTPDFRVQVYRRDQYVTRRDSCGDVLYHGIIEVLDPMDELTDKQRETCGLKDSDLKDKPTPDRMKSMVTFVDWQPWTKCWVVSQECNGVVFNESQENNTPFCSVPMHLVAGEHYGRGLVEVSWLPDLRSSNELMLRLLDWAAVASNLRPCIDPSSEVSDKDLQMPSGTPIRTARVLGGLVQDIGWLGPTNVANFQVVEQVAERVYASLSKSMAIESEVTPQKERTTATQVQRIAAELDGITGGNWGSITEESQVPKVRYFTQLARDKGLLPKAKDRAVQIEIVSGLAAFARQAKLSNILSSVDVLSRLGPEGVARIDIGVLADVMTRYQNIYVPGLVKDDAQMAKEAQAQVSRSIQEHAGQQAATTTGNIIENALAGQTA